MEKKITLIAIDTYVLKERPSQRNFLNPISNKFTNQQLYSWMVSQISSLYFHFLVFGKHFRTQTDVALSDVAMLLQIFDRVLARVATIRKVFKKLYEKGTGPQRRIR